MKEESSTLDDFLTEFAMCAVGLGPLRLGGPDFRCTKISARPGSDFIYTKVFGAFLRFFNQKTAYILKHFPAAREFGQEIL